MFVCVCMHVDLYTIPAPRVPTRMPTVLASLAFCTRKYLKMFEILVKLSSLTIILGYEYTNFRGYISHLRPRALFTLSVSLLLSLVSGL